MLPVVQIGPAAIPLPGLLLLLGVWVGSWLAERGARRAGVSADPINRMILVALIAGILGARLGYAARYPTVYIADPLALVALAPGTLAPDVGLGIGIIAALVHAQRQRLPLWPTLDALTPGVAGFAVFLALGHLASGDAFGAPSDVPWSIELWGAARHPAQMYELLAALAVLLIVQRLSSTGRIPGFSFAVFAGLSAGACLALEAFRGDSVLWFGDLRAAQVASLALLLGALGLLRWLAQRSQQPAC